jgi:hypothetical protein
MKGEPVIGGRSVDHPDTEIDFDIVYAPDEHERFRLLDYVLPKPVGEKKLAVRITFQHFSRNWKIRQSRYNISGKYPKVVCLKIRTENSRLHTAAAVLEKNHKIRRSRHSSFKDRVNLSM